MTLFDNETSQSNEATATLTAPEGSTSATSPEPEAHAESALEAAASVPVLAEIQGEIAAKAPAEAKPEALPAARPAVELPAHEEAAAEDFATALENYENSSAEPEEAAADRLINGTVVKITATHVVVDLGAKSEGVVP